MILFRVLYLLVLFEQIDNLLGEVNVLTQIEAQQTFDQFI